MHKVCMMDGLLIDGLKDDISTYGIVSGRDPG